MKKWIVILCCAVCFNVIGLDRCNAHKEIKEAMEAKYAEANLAISCKLCHGKTRAMRTDFGKLFEKEFKGKNFTMRLKAARAAKPANPEAVQKIVDEMVAEFKEALEKVEQMKPEEDGLTYGELIQQAKLENVKVKEKDQDKEADDE